MLNDEEVERMSQQTQDDCLEEDAAQEESQVDIINANDHEVQNNNINEEQPAEENELRAQDLENIAILYDQVRSIRRKLESNIDKKLAEDFDSHLKKVMYDLSVSLQELQDGCDQRHDSELMKKKIILFTKKSLIGIC